MSVRTKELEVSNGYIPGEHAMIFHKDRSKVRLFLCALGSGKTCAGANETVRLAVDEEYCKYHNIPFPPKIWVVGRDFPTVLDTAWEELWKWIPHEVGAKSNKQDHTIEFPDGGFVKLVSGDDPDSLRSANVNAIWVDEPAILKEESWRNILGRANRGVPCIIYMTGTPKGYNWLYEQVWVRARKLDWLLDEESQEGHPDYFAFRVPAWRAGRMTEAEIAEMRETMSQDWFMQEYGGDFRAFHGLVYQEFMRHRHVDLYKVWRPTLEIREFWGAIDWGYNDPAVGLLFGRHEGGFVQDEEYYHTRRDPDELIEWCLERQEKHKTLGWWADPSRPDLIARARRRGLRIFEADNAVVEGIEEVRRWLRRDSEVPGLLINPACRNTIREYMAYTYPDTGGRRGAHELPKDKDNHTQDSTRYLLYSIRERKLVGPSAEKKKRREIVTLVKPRNSYTGY